MAPNLSSGLPGENLSVTSCSLERQWLSLSPSIGSSMPFLIATRRVVSACARRIRLSISRRESPPPYARHLKQFLDLKSVNCVLDVGAFGGGFASVLRSSGFEGTIISFEPVPSSYVLLQQHMAS